MHRNMQDMARGGGRLSRRYILPCTARASAAAHSTLDVAAHQHSPLRAKSTCKLSVAWAWLHSKKAYTRRGGVREQQTCSKLGSREESRLIAMHHSPASSCKTGQGRRLSATPTLSSSRWERTQHEADMSTAACVGKAYGSVSCAHQHQQAKREIGSSTVDLWEISSPPTSKGRG